MVVIADGDDEARATISKWLIRAGHKVAETTSGPETLDLVRLLQPEVVLIEPALPELCGYEVCKQIRDDLGEAVRIVFISATRTEPMDFVAGMLIGADHYLSKPIVPDELLAQIRRLLQRSAGSPNGHFSTNEHAVGSSALSRGRLTARELEVLGLLAEGFGQQEVAARLFISTRTVGTHIDHIRAKLGVRNRAQAVAAAYRGGFLFESQRDGREGNLIHVAVDPAGESVAPT